MMLIKDQLRLTKDFKYCGFLFTESGDGFVTVSGSKLLKRIKIEDVDEWFRKVPHENLNQMGLFTYGGLKVRVFRTIAHDYGVKIYGQLYYFHSHLDAMTFIRVYRENLALTTNSDWRY